MKANAKLDALRELLLDDDRKERDDLAEKLDAIHTLLSTREELEPKVVPIIQDRLTAFEAGIPKTLGPAITAALKREIANSRDQVVDALFPIIGKMIKKYISHEMEVLKQQIDEKMKILFSWRGLKLRIKSMITKKPMSQLVLYDVNGAQLEEMMVIENESGLLKGAYSRNESIDRDMVAGMLTAIKSFVEDAFDAGTQDLEHIEYENYNIYLYTFQSFYMAVVTTGIADAVFKANLRDTVMDFAGKYLSTQDEAENEIAADVSHQLEAHFA